VSEHFATISPVNPVSSISGTLTRHDGAVDPDHAVVVRHGVSALIGKVLNLGSTVLMTVGLARILSPAEFAEFNIIRMGMTLLAVAASAGVAQTALRLLGRAVRHEQFDVAEAAVHVGVKRSILPLAIAGLVMWPLSLIIGHWAARLSLSWTDGLLIAAGTVLLGASDVFSDLIRGLGRPEVANAFGGTKGATIANLLLLLIVMVLTLIISEVDSLQAIIAATVATGVVFSVGIGLLVRWNGVLRRNRLHQNGPSITTYDRLIIQFREASFPVALSAALTLCCYQGDVFLVGLFADPLEIPAYVAARRLVLLLSIPLTIANTMASGVISPLVSSGRHELLQGILQAAAAAAALPCLLFAAFGLFLPEMTLAFTLGDGYASSARLLQILIPGQVLLVVTGSCGILMVQTGNQRTFLWINAVSFLFLACCCTLAAKWFGAIGLASAVSFLVGSINVMIWVAARRLTGINTWCNFSRLRGVRSLLRSPQIHDTQTQPSNSFLA
jgi:O-antigen/teichoic acid export membrane protein